MSVHANIILRKEVPDLDKADDWFAEIQLLLQGKTECSMQGHSSNQEDKVQLTREQESE